MATTQKIGTSTLTAPVLGDGITNGSITTGASRPYSLDTMDVDSAMIWEALDRKLQVESTLGEVFCDIGADVVYIPGKAISVPDACIMKLSGNKGARTQTLGMVDPLVGPGRVGTGQAQRGYERSRTLRHMKIYYNEWSQALMGEKWGVNFNDLDVWSYYEGEQRDLSKWFAEDEGMQYREALLETVAYPISDGYTGAGTDGLGITQHWNPNWFVANTELGSQPAYSATLNTFTTNITTAMAAADTGTNGVNANIDLDYLLALDHYATTEKRIEPITVDGKKKYIVLLPSRQYHKLRLDNDGQLGNVWTKVSCMSEKEQMFPGIVGGVGNLIIIEDQRYPEVTGDADYGTSTTLTSNYVYPGNNDDRTRSVYNSTSNPTWDIGFLMGKGALVDWMVTPLHFETQEDEYGKLYGKGAFVERGIQLGRFDLDTAGGAMRNKGSIVLAFSSTSVVTTA